MNFPRRDFLSVSVGSGGVGVKSMASTITIDLTYGNSGFIPSGDAFHGGPKVLKLNLIGTKLEGWSEIQKYVQL